MHKSSLSVPSYATIALERGDVERAYRYLTIAVNSDLGDLYHNTELGVHAAAIGGAWQIVVFGFGGVRLKNGVLSINPILPNHWHKMRFRLWFKDSLIEFALSHGESEAIMLGGRKGVDIEFYGKRHFLQKGQRVHA